MNPTYPFIICLCTFALGLTSIPAYIRLARDKKIVDVPNQRSSHLAPTPRGGGIFICLGTVASLLSLMFISGATPISFSCLLGTITVTAIGFADDLRSLPSLLRLGGHYVCSAMILAGVLNSGYTEIEDPLGPSNWLFVIGLSFWIVGNVNIYNFMDGIDGIATIQGIVASIAWLVISTISDSLLGTTLSCSILGGLIAFLLFNWSPAKVFMGDGASGFLGFSFAVIPLLVAQPTLVDIWKYVNIGSLCLFPFLFDGTFTLLRRALLKENVLKAHRSHLYQRWHLAGSNHRMISTYYGGWALCSGTAAILVHFEILGLIPAYSIALVPAIFLLLKSKKFPSNSR